MSGWFPTPYRDELFYGVCARYAAMMNYTNKTAVFPELFGEYRLRVSFDFPRSLDSFVSKLPAPGFLTVERIANEFTLLPFFFPFLPKERVNRIINLLSEDTRESVYIVAGIVKSNVSFPNFLRYCPVCADSDLEIRGTTYWHRIHQLPGIIVCPEHSFFLENSSASRMIIDRKAGFLNSTEYIPDSSVPRPIDMTNAVEKQLLLLAKDAEWLLEQNLLCPGYDFLYGIYFDLLYEQDLLDIRGRIDSKNLIKRFRETYQEEFLQSVQCGFSIDDRSNWVINLIRDLKLRRVHYPLRHLLLIGLLGETAESFFNRVPVGKRCAKPLTPSGYFISGPYPCLNAVCPNYKKKVVNDYHVQKSGGSAGFTLYVTCQCGFSYARKGPDQHGEDIFRRDYMKDYGSLWREKLSDLWSDSALSVLEVAGKLNVDKRTLKKQATELNLDFPRQGPSSQVVRVNITDKNKIQERIERNKKSVSNLSKNITANRAAWLKALADYPSTGRSELKRSVVPSVANWLAKHDRSWLNDHQPALSSRRKSLSAVDWNSRGEILTAEISAAVERIKRYAGKPVQITNTSISREIEHQKWLRNASSVAKMPSVTAILEEAIETQLAYELRRIRYAFEEIKNDNEMARFDCIARIAWINRKRWDVKEINESITSGIAKIEERRNFLRD